MSDRDSKIEAYRATTYRTEVSGRTIDLHIGHIHPLDELLAGYECKEWAFVTAQNPGGREVALAENESRHQQLGSVLRNRGFAIFPGRGIPSRPGWIPEESYLILGIDRDVARALGREFGQVAIVRGRIGGAVELEFL